MEDLIEKIIDWARARNIVTGSTPQAQFTKTLEEVSELNAALISYDGNQVKDAIGDVVVTLVIIAEQLGVSLEDCVAHAYNEIKDRKGKMIGGVFVKEEG